MDKDKILNSFFQTNSLNALTQQMCEELECPVIITDSTFHIVCSYSSFEYDDVMYKKAIMHSELSPKVCAQIAEYSEKSRDNHFQINLNNEKTVCIGILINAGMFMGYILYFLNKSRGNFSDINDLSLCENLIAKQLYLERYCSSSAENTAEEILENLIEDKYSSKELFDLQTAGTYLSHYSPKYMAIIDFTDSFGIENTHNHLQTVLASHYHASHPFFYKNMIILFLHEDHDFRFLYDIAKEYKTRIVVSDNLKDLYDIKNHYEIMSETVSFIKDQKRGACVAFESDYSLFVKLRELKKYTSLILPEIRELMDYDAANKSELCRTLYTYLICSHSLKKTSEILYAHSNTVFYRIQKAKNDFNVKLDEPDMHFAYLVSLALAQLNSENGEMFILGKNDASERSV